MSCSSSVIVLFISCEVVGVFSLILSILIGSKVDSSAFKYTELLTIY
jgi:hypothetical protein